MFSPFTGRYAYLEDFYIRPQYRNKGLGSNVINKIADVSITRKFFACTVIEKIN